MAFTLIQGSRTEGEKSRSHAPLRLVVNGPFVALTAADLGLAGSFIRVTEIYAVAERRGYNLIKNIDSALLFAKSISAAKKGVSVLVASEPILNGAMLDEPGFHLKSAVNGKEGIALMIASNHFGRATVYVFAAKEEEQVVYSRVYSGFTPQLANSISLLQAIEVAKLIREKYQRPGVLERELEMKKREGEFGCEETEDGLAVHRSRVSAYSTNDLKAFLAAYSGSPYEFYPYYAYAAAEEFLKRFSTLEAMPPLT